MPYRSVKFVNGFYYHVFNRGVEKRKIFLNNSDFKRFLDLLTYYQIQGPKPSFSQGKRFSLIEYKNNPKIAEIICYCLMPNHFHIQIKQNLEQGIHELMRKVLDAYTKYFNTKYHRVGPLFQGQFKGVPIETDEQMMHLSRYIHLNPFVAGSVENPEEYKYSSLEAFITGNYNLNLCNPEAIINYFKDKETYQAFVNDQQDYAKELDTIKHLTFEED